MPRLPKKKTRILAEKKAYGETLGKLKAEAHFYKTKKGFWFKIKQIFSDMVRNVNWGETGAVLAGAWIIYSTWIPDVVADIIGVERSQIKNEVALFGLSYFVSYVLIKHFGNIARATAQVGKGIIDLIRTLILSSAVAGAGAGAGSSVSFWLMPLGLASLGAVAKYGETMWWQEHPEYREIKKGTPQLPDFTKTPT